MPTDLVKDIFGDIQTPEPWILDRSTLEDFADCPFKATLRQSNPQPAGDLALVGTEIHKLIAESLDWCKENADATPGDYFEQEAPKCRPDIQPEVLRAAKNVAFELGKINLSKIIGIEYQIDYQLPGFVKDRPVVITTAVDLLQAGADETILIDTDWKSGYKKRTNAEAFDSFQAQFHATILWKMYPSVNTIHFFYKETRWGTCAYARFERNAKIGLSALTQEQAFMARIMEAVRIWAEGSQEAWPEPSKCAWCDYTDRCPHVSGDLKSLVMNEREFVDQLVVVEARSAAMWKYVNERIKSGQVTVLRGTNATIEKSRPDSKFTTKIYSKTNHKDD